MRPSSLLALTAATLALVSFGVGCGGPSYAHTDIDQISVSALPGAIDVQTISIAVGGVTTAHVVSYDSDNKAMGNTIDSDNPSVIEVHPTTADHQYAFLGISAGTAHITVKADGDPVLTITATISPQ